MNIDISNKKELLAQLAERAQGTMTAHLGIEVTDIQSQGLSGRMPVDQRTIQPTGILHGGASVTFAETLGSIATYLLIDQTQYLGVGLEINANHIRPVPLDNYVYGQATAIHLGRTTHIWDITITNEAGKLVCSSRLTMAIVEKAKRPVTPRI